MNSTKLAIVVLYGLISYTSGQCKSRTLDLGEFLSIAETEILGGTFCGSQNPDDCIRSAEPLWEASNEDEWKRGLTEYTRSGTWFPYAFCHVGEGMSGNERKESLMASLNASLVEETRGGTSSIVDIRKVVDKLHVEKTLKVAILSNTEEKLCGIVRLPPPFACSMADDEGDDIIVNPLHTFMKISAETTAILRRDYSDINLNLPDPIFVFNLCPDGRSEIGLHNTQTTIDITYRFVDYLLENAPDEGCDDMYDQRISAALVTGNPNANNDPDALYVTFNRRNAQEWEFDCAAELIKAMARLPVTCSVELEQETEVDNEVSQYITQSGIRNYRPMFNAGITGKDQIVAVSDTGLDIGSCYFNQDLLPNTTIIPSNRKVVQYIPFADGREEINGHGTHVCGTLAGHRSDNGNKEQNDDFGNGVAKGAKIAFLDIGISGEGFLTLPSDSVVLNTGRGAFDYRNNAHIHSASWGTPVTDSNRKVANGYTTRTRNFDNYMVENDDFLIFVAAGNDGRYNQPNSVGTPATAKNIISVGAHINRETSMDIVSDFSSRGPTQDGRIKPDLIAPGQTVNSAAAGADCGLTRKQGTSMAAPAAAGSAAIIREYFEEGWWPKGKKGSGDIVRPPGALLKAILINGAQFMTAAQGRSSNILVSPYDNNQGFGRINLKESIYVAGKTDVLLDVDIGVVEDGTSIIYNKTISRANGCSYPEFRVTLVWNDEGSIPSCVNCLVDDLDLLVTRTTVDGFKTNFYPNGRNSRDTVNNVERVIVGNNVIDGDYFEMRVSGTNLASPNRKYAIAMTGCLDPDSIGGGGFKYKAPESSANDNNLKSIIIVANIVGGAILALLL